MTSDIVVFVTSLTTSKEQKPIFHAFARARRGQDGNNYQETRCGHVALRNGQPHGQHITRIRRSYAERFGRACTKCFP